ncbi:M56 family metallopeptidase [Oscillibacter sp. MSJ-31]|uniref:M56 family metallopeptidase n=1 Tax=Oscillibacter sp. MSJ-31 TaxID=2841526 RepID=UPI001C10C6EE|nr:M56 family metallopeptidase [Oscillibacter sp. MSJ-31]MBU5457339.1 M56 family metallopeptidase [Oscillibacter sp. MSJ-31]
MKEILLTSSVLILALLALRQLFRRTVSRRMQYALWLLVLVRLLVPVNVGTLAHNVLSAAEPVQAVVEERLDTPVLYVQGGTERRPAQLLPGKESQGEPLSPQSDAAQSAPADEYYTVTPTYRTVTLSEALTYVWYAGMVGVGAWFLFTNLRFARALRKARTPYRVEGCRYPVYLMSALPSPCLFGVLRPAIYLNNAAAASPELLRFVLAHEQTHARHLDPLWSLLRGLCLTVYWFDPLVWLAAVLSREDGELACDEGTLRALGADERTAYGKALLSLVPVCTKPQNPLLGATTMTGGKRSLKERITRIAENRQAKTAAVFAAVALAALVCAVSFTGAPDTPPEVTQEWYDAGFTTEDAQACLEFLDWAAELDGSKITGCGAWDAETGAAHFLLEEPSDDTSAQIEALEGILRSVRAEELTPFAARDGEVRYTLSFNDDYTGYYGFSLSENGQVALDAPAVYETEGEPFPYMKAVAVVDNAELTQALYRLLRPALLDGLTAAQRDAVDSFLHWAQALRAEDILNLQFRDGSSSRFLVDAELTALSAQLVPALNALTEAELYTQQGYGDSAYYTLAVNLRDGTQYTFLCGFDRVRLLHPTFEPGLSSSYPSDRPTLWIDSPALMACLDSLEASPAPLPDFETAAPTPLADILPAREPWMTIPLAGKAQRVTDRRIPSDALDWLIQMDMDGDGVCEIVNSSPNFPAIYYKRGGQLYGVDLKSVITAAWPELNWWDFTSAAPAIRSVLFYGLSAGDAPGDGVNFTRYLYFDGESLLLYKPDRSHTDHIADATLADPSVPAEVAARAKQLVRQRYDTLAGSAAQYDDWYTDVSFLGAETRYEGLAPEVYSFSQHYHAQKPEKILLAGGTEVDEDGWAILDGDTVLDGPYIVCLMDGGTRRMLEGSMSGDCSTGSPAYYADLTALLAKNNVLRPDALDGGLLNEAMSSGGSFLNWLGQYDAAEQDRALERLSAYRASLTDSYDLDMFSRIVAYLLGDRDGLTDAGRAAQERFRAKFG